MNYQQRLDKLAAELEKCLPGAYKWASRHVGDYAQALALQSVADRLVGVCQVGLDAFYEWKAHSVEDVSPLSTPVPADLLLAACDAAGILDDVLSQLRLQIVASNGCVSVLCAGKLLASLPEATWRERLKAARGGAYAENR